MFSSFAVALYRLRFIGALPVFRHIAQVPSEQCGAGNKGECSKKDVKDPKDFLIKINS